MTHREFLDAALACQTYVEATELLACEARNYVDELGISLGEARHMLKNNLAYAVGWYGDKGKTEHIAQLFPRS